MYRIDYTCARACTWVLTVVILHSDFTINGCTRRSMMVDVVFLMVLEVKCHYPYSCGCILVFLYTFGSYVI